MNRPTRADSLGKTSYNRRYCIQPRCTQVPDVTILLIEVLRSCISGTPQPQVVWLKNGNVVDDECEHVDAEVNENRLLWLTVGRQDLGSSFTCQATNTKLMDPRQSTVTLDLRREYGKRPRQGEYGELGEKTTGVKKLLADVDVQKLGNTSETRMIF